VDPDAPWQLNLLVIILTSVITGSLAVLGAWLSTRRRFLDQANSLEAIAHEVRPNSGSSMADATKRIEAAQFVMTEQVAGLREDLGGLHAEMRDVRQDIAGMRTDARHDRRDIAQVRQEAVTAQRALDEHLQAVPALVAETVAKAESAHIRRCPQRRTKE